MAEEKICLQSSLLNLLQDRPESRATNIHINQCIMNQNNFN